MTFLKTITATAIIGTSALSMPSPAVAGWGCGWGCGWGAAFAGFGVGAIVGSALAPTYVVPPPPPDYYYYYRPADYEAYYYGPAEYGPEYGPARPPSRRGTHPNFKSPSPAATSQTSKASGLISSQQKAQAKFKAAQAKAKRAGVDALTQADIEGLNPEQLKQIRGY
jgi:hypothetical protein